MRATDIPRFDSPPGIDETGHHFTAMASRVTVRLPRECPDRDSLLGAVTELFASVERHCSRFVESSDLSRLNRAPDEWHEVSPTCFAVVAEAYLAYLRSGGRFDPRTITALRALGYDRSFAFGDKPASTPSAPADTSAMATAGRSWGAEFDPDRHAIRLGGDPIDLGGIGKGFALARAAELIAGQAEWWLVEAGGDCVLGGPGPTGDGWSVGVEDPLGGTEPAAVMSLSDTACATSSIRHRSWRAGDRPVHHLIDPRTGSPGGAGLAAVTVVGPDPAAAEVASKVLFLAGAGAVAAEAERLALTALWITDAGELSATGAARALIRWERQA